MFLTQKNTYKYVFGLLLIVNLFFSVHRASAATIVVNTLHDELNSDGDCSFHEAVVASENNANVDGCVGVGSYGNDTIDLTGLSGSIPSCPGDLTITQSLTVTGPGSSTLSLDNPFCDQRLFTFDPVNPSSTLNISGISATYFGDQSYSSGIPGGFLNILDGTVSLDDVTFMGGVGDTGIIDVSSSSTLTVTNSTFKYGLGGKAGAIYNNGGNVTVSHSNFINNAGSLSGAVYNSGIMNIDNSLFDGNYFAEAMHIFVASGGVTHVTNSVLQNATIGFGAIKVASGGTFTMDGGSILNNINPEAGSSALENHGDSTFTNVFIDGNDGDACISNNEGTLLLDSIVLSHCLGSSLGGSRTIFILLGVVTLRNSSIINNTNNFIYPAAGVYQAGGTFRVEGTTIANNAATTTGTGFYLAGGTTTVVNSTIANNTGGDGTIYVDGGALQVFNTTFANNTASSAANSANVTVNAGTASFTNTILSKSGTGKNCKGSFTNGGHNLQYGDSTCTGITLAATNPLSVLGLQNNGGSTQTIALSDTSEALDVADNAVCTDAATVNSVDQRGYVRPSNLVCDIGAFEFQVIPPDTTAPTVTNVTSSTANGTYKAGGVISLEVVFDEAVTVSGTPHLTLETGATDAVVDYASGSGSDTLTFTYTVASGENSADLDYADTNALALNGGSIVDGALNPADLTLAVPGAAGSLGANKNLVIDTTAPVFSSVTPLSNFLLTNVTNASGVGYTLSEVLSSGAITVTRTGGTADGSSPHTCTLVGTARAVGSHTLDFSDTTNGCSSAVSLVSGAIYTFQFNGSDVATNAAITVTRTNVTFDPVVPDTTAPTVTNVTSSTANGTYKAGGVISIQVVFDEAVMVSGTPHLTLETGATDAVVDYASGSGSDTLTFTYTVASGENSADLDYADTNALALNGGSIVDGALNPADLTLAVPGAAGSLGANKNLVIDTTAPVFSSVTPLSNFLLTNVTNASGVGYTLSEVLSSGAITVTRTGGTADGSSPHTCTLVGTARAVGSHTLDFSDTTNGCSSAVSLVSGAIYTFQFNGSDVATNAAITVTRTNVTFDPVVPDTTAPTVTNVTSSTANGTYKEGGVISLQVVFDEAVTVSGTPQLTLETGATDAVVDYASGSGSDTLTFTYTVASGENSTDLDYADTNALALNGGSIVDGALNPADLTLAVPGAAGSLGANKNLVIDTTAPVIATLVGITPNPTTDTTPNFTFSSDEAGTISYLGSCSSLTTLASLGSNTITFSALSLGVHANCSLSVSDLAGNISNVLSISSFTVTAPVNNENNNPPSDHGVSRGGGGGGGGIKKPANTQKPPTDTSKNTVFNDIKGYKYEKDIIELAKQCDLQGYADELSKNLRNFKPNGNISRGELAIMLMKCKFGPLPFPKKITPIDVSIRDVAAPYIQKGFDTGTLEGYKDKTFKSKQNVIAAEALKMIELTWIPMEKINQEAQNETCDDVDQSLWLAKYYDLVLNANILFDNSSNNNFHTKSCFPTKEITRGEIAHIILHIKNAS